MSRRYYSGVFIPTQDEYEDLVQEIRHQKQNKYTPLVDVTARNFVEKAPLRSRARNNIVTFRGEGTFGHAIPVVEVDPNPIYLRAVQDDALNTNPGQPFHPAFPGSTKALRQPGGTLAASAGVSIGSYGDVNDNKATLMRTHRGIAHDHSRSDDPHPLDEGHNFLRNPNTATRPSSSPAGATSRQGALTRTSRKDRRVLSEIDSGSFYQEAVVGSLNMIVDPFSPAAAAHQNLARTHMDHRLAKERREREMQELQQLATQQASVHQQHHIRNSCSEAVNVIRQLLSFRGVDTAAKDGPHNAVTNRFMQLEFLQDLQWLLRDGPTLVRYPAAGAGGAPHLRYFTIRHLPWSPGPNDPPIAAPFLVWMNDSRSANFVGKCPLANLLGVTKDPNESIVLKRFVNHDGKSIKGPYYSNMKKVNLPIEHCASLWFLCYVTGDMSSNDYAQPLDFEQSQKAAAANLQRAAGSPERPSSGIGRLDAETAAARGFAPLNSTSGNQQQSGTSGRPRSSTPPTNAPRQKLKPGSLGRINIDVASLQYGDIVRFVKLMEGIASVNEVLVKRGR